MWKNFLRPLAVTRLYLIDDLWIKIRSAGCSLENAMPLNIAGDPLGSPVEEVDLGGTVLQFVAFNDLLVDRARFISVKEPSTIEWIDGFSADDVFWDIGANVGVFSLYAAKKAGVRVLAFEPAFFNFDLLNQNIILNVCAGKVVALPLAVADEMSVGSFNLSQTKPGSALHVFGDVIDYKGDAFTPCFEQGMVAMPVDMLVSMSGVLFPTHMKIDVDGNEERIVRGAARTLGDSRLKSLMIELDVGRPTQARNLVTYIESHGLGLALAHHPHPESRVRNHFFIRKQ